MKNTVKWREVNAYHVDNEVRQLPGVVRRKIVATTFDKEHFGVELTMEIFESLKVRADVFTHYMTS